MLPRQLEHPGRELHTGAIAENCEIVDRSPERRVRGIPLLVALPFARDQAAIIRGEFHVAALRPPARHRDADGAVGADAKDVAPGAWVAHDQDAQVRLFTNQRQRQLCQWPPYTTKPR